MAPDVANGQATQLGKKLDDVVKQRMALEEQERTLRQAMRTMPDPQAEASVAETQPVEEVVVPPTFVCDRFMQGLAWMPWRLNSNLGWESVIRKYSILPVTLYCGFDPASQEVEATLTRLFEGSCRVTFRVRHFCGEDPCAMEDVLAEKVAISCFHCPGKDGEADTIYARALRKKLHHTGKGWTNREGGIPGAHAVFGHGWKDPFAVLYRNSRGDSGLVCEALEALGSKPLLKHVYGDQDSKEGVPAVARQWACALAQKVEDWSRGSWEREEEIQNGPEWTFEEVMRDDFVKKRRGMQDG